jgi:hypothetical protein
MDNQDVIATLNSLLEISRDGEQGFRTCAEGVQSPNLRCYSRQRHGVAPRARQNSKPRFAVLAVSPQRGAP